MSVTQKLNINPSRTHDLTHLPYDSASSAPASSSSSSSLRPTSSHLVTDEAITTLLASRSRSDLPYTRVGPSGSRYVLINPLRALENTSDECQRTYQREVEDCYSSRKAKQRDDGSQKGDQPHVFELAGRAWLLMTRRKESQSVLYHGLTGSGKSTASRHFTTQILGLASPSKPQKSLSDQINYLFTLLESFGHSKTPLNPSATHHAKLLELHFTSSGHVNGAKVLPFGLNKSRLGRLQHEERSFHVFYQMLAGASPDERDALSLEDPSSYALLAQSGCYRLPGGLFSDDAAQMGELRAAFASLGFKAKHVRSILTLLTTILLLSNLTFSDDTTTGSLGMTSLDQSARVEDREMLESIAAHLGVGVDEVETVLVNRTKWIKNDLCSILLDAKGAAEQRDSLMRELYAILFTFVVEMANKKLDTSTPDSPPELQILQLDLPGWNSKSSTTRPSSTFGMSTLINTSGPNGFEEFSVNYMNELVHSYILQRTFSNDAGPSSDGIALPSTTLSSELDNAACIELLRGGTIASVRLAQSPVGIVGLLSSATGELKAEEREDVRSERLIQHLDASSVRSAAYIREPATTSPGLSSNSSRSFGIKHYVEPCTYDVHDFVERNNDVLDKQLVDLLRSSADPFIAKLVSGPGLATEGHPLDPNITVEAQVSVSPLRTLTPIVNPGPNRSGSSQETLRKNRRSTLGGVGDEWPLDTSIPQPVTLQLNSTLSTILLHLNQTRVWTVNCIRPNDSGHPGSFDKRRVKAQVGSLLLPQHIQRYQNEEYIADDDLAEFCRRHDLSVQSLRESAQNYVESRGWTQGTDYDIGKDRIWMSWDAWREQEDEVRRAENPPPRLSGDGTLTGSDEDAYAKRNRLDSNGYYGDVPAASTDDLLVRRRGNEEDYSPHTPGNGADFQRFRETPDYPVDPRARLLSDPKLAPSPNTAILAYTSQNDLGPLGDYGNDDKKLRLDDPPGNVLPSGDGGGEGEMIVHEKKHHATEVIATTSSRRWWLRITWFLTWWIPTPLLAKLGGMKRADVRLAWREKVAIFIMIMLMCGIVLFYIVVFGMLLCPDSDKAWNPTELAQHAGDDDYYAAIAGKVYDFTKFYKGQHSDIQAYPTTSDVMLEFAGQDLTDYFPMPMTLACPDLVTSEDLTLLRANFTPVVDYAIHTSGKLQATQGTKLDDGNWYNDRLTPGLQQYYKGSLVYDNNYVQDQADGVQRQWAIYKKKVYDLSDYLYTAKFYSASSGTDLPSYNFLNSDLSALFSTQAGQDITKAMDEVLQKMSTDDQARNLGCLDKAFYVGELDYRLSARCTVQNYLLLAFSIILMVTIGSKFLAALQLGSKRQPELLDKFVICQVPCYTEGEESLKRTIDSLAVLNYDDKRKLIFVICDGNIIGSGNNRPTPRIVLDILGVDPQLDPEPLLFKSIGEGSKQLNYAKVFSGLYEHEGHVVPYVVVVKVGKPTESSKPGNRGKRDSQVMLLQYLNRVHFDAAMCPLELEIYHQMRNVIGIDPTFYEYIFQVDADTTVTPDSLNRMISCTADDQRIIGICGETKVENERESLTTMIQVYEYYISHHLTKAFESLFGSVTCLPGCFSVYRIRTADKGRPVIISSLVIDEYAEPNVDTLHKKNLFSLGEDRYLTTLMMKHFPTFKLKFTPDAIAHTIAPSRWNVLLSQRRRWINSTIHNLVELLFLPEMCGFCFFSMRFVVFLDLLGTIILPATCGYLIYLIVIVSTGKAPIPVISLAMIGAVYGLQALIFILKREFMLVGWMIVYILAFPVYSVFLPLYSFWSMDDFSWGNTRKVVGEGSNKTVVYEDDEPFNDSMIPYKSFKEYESGIWETTSQHSDKTSHTAHTRTTQTSRTGRSRLAPSIHSRAPSELPPGADYWRDSSPMGASHSSRNLQHMASNPAMRHSQAFSSHPGGGGLSTIDKYKSMAGLSMWGPGSDVGGPTAGQIPGPGPGPGAAPGPGGSPFLPPMYPNHTGGAGGVGLNPFDSPAMSDYGGLRPPTLFPTYPQAYPSPPTMNQGLAPRNSVMSGLNTFAGPAGAGGPGLNQRASSYSLATTLNPFGGTGATAAPVVDHDSNPSDDKVLGVLRRYLASQDLISITKRQTREALYALFPNAKLDNRAAWVNQNIDTILSSV